mmetsp:Transcript_13209/g.55319  ORF Transcript_13209/g.55319 Transcript_13209/m.55319 type:complete len:212 (+) Transcript_13209:4865-5500(+)
MRPIEPPSMSSTFPGWGSALKRPSTSTWRPCTDTSASKSADGLMAGRSLRYCALVPVAIEYSAMPVLTNTLVVRAYARLSPRMSATVALDPNRLVMPPTAPPPLKLPSLPPAVMASLPFSMSSSSVIPMFLAICARWSLTPSISLTPLKKSITSTCSLAMPGTGRGMATRGAPCSRGSRERLAAQRARLAASVRKSSSPLTEFFMSWSVSA